MFRQSPKEGCETLGLLRFRWKRNRHLQKRFPYPAASTSLRRAGLGSIPRRHEGIHLFWPWWSELRLKHDWALEPTCLQEKSLRGKKKRSLSCLALKKDKGRGSSILFSSRELQDWGSFREGRGLHFVEAERMKSIRREPKNEKLSLDRKDIDEISL